MSNHHWKIEEHTLSWYAAYTNNLEMLFVKNLSSALIKTLCLSFCMLLLAGCAGKAVKDDDASLIPAEETLSANYWFKLASETEGMEKADYSLNGIAVLINTQQYAETHQILEDVFQLPLSVLNSNRWRLYKTISSSNEENFEAALKQYAFLETIQEPPFSLDDQQLLLKGHARSYAFSGNYLEALHKRIELSALLLPEQQQQNNDEIWKILQSPTAEYLRLFDDSPSENRVIHGWINLALINKMYTGHPRELMQALSIWRSRFAEHPAQLLMPSSISELSQANLIEPQHIAVLIPQTGRLATVGKIIRKGIEAAYLSKINTGGTKPSIKFYDSNVDDIVALYQLTLAEGAEFIIGPLKKKSINSLLEYEGLTTPILVLNMLDKEFSPDITAYQFGLPVENEARQVAEKFWSENLDRAAVLVPDSSAGERALKAFKDQYERLDGKVVVQRHYLNGRDYSKVVRALLGVENSTKRRQQLQKILGQPVEYEERRRKDIDGIFLFTNASEGRRLKPLLDYYYAQDIPVFSTSTIFQGNKTDIKNKDLENVTFINIPWLLNDSEDTDINRNSLEKLWPETVTGKNAHFFAFGFDAYKLVNELAVLEVFPLQYLEGKTGRLFLTSKKQMARDLPWVTFHKGKIQWQGYLDDIQQVAQ